MVPERSTPWRFRVCRASSRASAGSMPSSSMFSLTSSSKAAWEIVRTPFFGPISDLRLRLSDDLKKKKKKKKKKQLSLEVRV